MRRCSSPRYWPAWTDRAAFTLVELLVVISVIGVLVTMLIPAVNLARESSRKAACQSNLRQFGLGMSVYADQRNGVYCSGAFDWRRDGAVTEVGWVADLVNQGIPVGKMLCGSNSATVADTFNDLLAGQITADACVDHLGKPPHHLARRDGRGEPVPPDHRGQPGTGQRGSAATRPGADSREALQHELHGELAACSVPTLD